MNCTVKKSPRYIEDTLVDANKPGIQFQLKSIGEQCKVSERILGRSSEGTSTGTLYTVYASCGINCLIYAHISNESQKENVDNANAEVYFPGR